MPLTQKQSRPMRPNAAAVSLRSGVALGGESAPGPRMDMHCHSRASSGPALAALGMIGCPECYSPPEKVYDQAMARGMDLVTITDHDTIDGAMELHERGFQNFVVGEEVTVYFPEDRCKLHVLVWGLTPERHEEIGTLGLRQDVYRFAEWLAHYNLPHALAHPLYIQNGRLTRWHIERCALLFKGFETLNGAHSGTHRGSLDRYLDSLTPARVQAMVHEHGISPLWPRIWLKARTGGSDDHGLLNIGRAWTELPLGDGPAIDGPPAFLRRVMSGAGSPGGSAGDPSLLAHQLTTVGAHFAADRLLAGARPRDRYLAHTLLRFAGVDLAKPSKVRLVLEAAGRKVAGLAGRKKRTLPIVAALREAIGPILARHPDLQARLDPAAWTTGAPLAEHRQMAELADELTDAMTRLMSSGALEAVRRHDKAGIVDHLISYAILQAAQAPYILSLFHQNKERPFLERFDAETSPRATRPMRVSLFTDTLGDVNGVCRFIQNVAEQANETGRDLQVITSTKLQCPAWPNIFNFEPAFATRIPKYENLDIVLPPLVRILRHIDRHQPDVIHISTPGPVGLVGFVAARMLKVPVLGVYHTDFPAYIDRLFDDHAFTWITERFMRFFYSPFSRIFTRSDDYKNSVASLGIDASRLRTLAPGVDTEMFHPRFADPGLWTRLIPGSAPRVGATVRALYVGRVSVEKNLPFLTRVWGPARMRLAAAGIAAELIVVGDGPYRETMERELRGLGARFLGFRHGEELSAIYASSDLFIFPSTTDTLGQVVMESQASGLPVLVTDKGGPKEVVAEGRTGHVLDSEDSEAWLDAIVRLCTDTALRKQMGAEAHVAMQGMSIRRSFEAFWAAHEDAWRERGAVAGRAAEPRAAVSVAP